MATLQADGTWSQTELPSCIPVNCDVPLNPPNGKAIFTTVAYKVGPNNTRATASTSLLCQKL